MVSKSLETEMERGQNILIISRCYFCEFAFLINYTRHSTAMNTVKTLFSTRTCMIKVKLIINHLDSLAAEFLLRVLAVKGSIPGGVISKMFKNHTSKLLHGPWQ